MRKTALMILMVAAWLAGTGHAAAAESHVLDLSTNIGGTGWETIRDVAFDAQGNIYLAGATGSAGFPANATRIVNSGTCPNPPGPGNVAPDVLVIKLDPTGKTRLWSTVIGGPCYDRAYAIEVDGQGNVYLTGRAGQMFPTTAGTVQPVFNGFDAGPVYGYENAFIAKLSSDGSRLLWATYLGTGNAHRDITLDATGQPVVPSMCQVQAAGQVACPASWFAAGYRSSPTGPDDGALIKLSADGTRVVAATYGAEKPGTPSVRTDSTGAVVYLTQTTNQSTSTTPGAFDTTANGGLDIHISKFSANLAQRLWATWLGGSGTEFSETHGLAIDDKDNVIAAITTTSVNLPTTPGAVQPVYGGSGATNTGSGTNYPGDGYIAKLSSDGSTLLAATYYGGGLGEGIEGVGTDTQGRVYFSGATYSSNFPTTTGAAYRSNSGGADAFAVVLSPDLTQRLMATYIGGSLDDYARTLMVYRDGVFALAGESKSTNWPLLQPLQPAFGGGNGDVIFARFAPDTSGSAASASGLPVCVFRMDGSTSVAGALIQALQSSAIRASGTSDANGIYQFDTLADGTYDIRVSKAGFVTTLLRGILVAAGAGPMTEVRLPVPARVTGIVRDSQIGAAISLAMVTLKQGGVTKSSAYTSTEGAFTLLNVAPGTYEMAITKSGYQSFSRPDTVIGDGAAIDDPNLVLEPGVQLTGRVTDAATGAVLAGASVQLKQAGVLKASTSTSAAGTYVLATSLPAATYDVVVSKAGYVLFSRSAALPAAITVQDAALLILHLFTVTGTVRDSAGVAVAGVSVQLRVPVEPGMVTQNFTSTATSSTGVYTINNLLNGVYDVYLAVVPSGYMKPTTPVASLTINYADPLAVNGPTITLGRLMHTITGSVVRQGTATPVGSVGLRLEADVTPASTLGSQVRTTTSDGAYTFSNVQNGRYRIVVTSLPAGSDLILPTAPVSVTEILPSSPAALNGPTIGLAQKPQLPDLAPTPILRLTSGTLSSGQAVQFDSGVQNLGPVDSGDFSVRWKVDGQDVNPPAAGAHNPVPANTTVLDGNSQFTWTAQGGRHVISFIVDQGTAVVVQESNEANNVATLTVDVLQAVSTVTGQIQLADTGAAAVGVNVKLREATTHTDYLTRITGSDGKYTFSPVGAGTYEVVLPVVPAGYLMPDAVVLAPISAAAPITVTVPTITLDRGRHTLTGHVYRQGTTTPVGLVGVRLQTPPNGPATPVSITVSTAPDGSYTFTNVFNGTYQLVIVSVPAADLMLPTAPVEVPELSSTQPMTVTGPTIQLVVATSHTVAGTVVDTSGAGITGVAISLRRSSTGAGVASTITGQGGAFSFPNVFDGSYTLTLTSVPSGFQNPPVTRALEVTASAPATITVPPITLLRNVHTVSGLARDSAGAPVAGVCIQLRVPAEPGQITQTFTSAPTMTTGTYTILNVMNIGTAYEVLISAAPAGFQRPTTPVGTLSVQDSSPAMINGPTITLTRNSHTVTGRVVRQGTATPVGLVGLRLEIPGGGFSLTAATAPDGTYTFNNVLNGRYQLVVASVPAGDLLLPTTPFPVAELLPESPQTINGPTIELTVRLATVSGTVRIGSATGNALAGATVSLISTGPGRALTTSTDGTYRFADVAAGNYALNVTAPGYRFQPVAFTVGATDLVRDCIGSPITHTIRGQVFVTGSTTGPTGVALQLRETTTNAAVSVNTITNGVFSFSNVPNGTYELRVTGGVPSGFQLPTQAFAVGSLTDTSAEPFGAPTLVLARTIHTINGRVLRQGTATVVAGVALRLQDAQTHAPVAGQTATSDAIGNFSFTNVPNTDTSVNGAYEIAVTQATNYMIPVPKLIGQVTDTVPNPIDAGIIGLYPQGQTVRGTVRAGTATGAVVSLATVNVLPAGNPGGTPLGTATTDPAGAYTILGIPDGSYILQANAGSSYFVQSQNITIAGSSLVRDFILVTVLPDLMPTDIIVPAGAIVAGQSVLIDSGVRNVGGTVASGFNVRWKVDGQDTVPPTVGSHADVQPLTTDLSGNSWFQWTAVTGTHTITFIVDENNRVPEGSESNNQASVTVTVQPPPTYQVTGSVLRTDSIFGPIANLSVRIDPLGLTDMTDAMGVFVFPAIPAGNYTLVAAPVGFRPAQQAVTVTSAAVTQNIMVTPTVDLRPTALTLVSPAPIVEGQAVQFDSGVQNLGTGASGAFNIRWKVDGQDVNPIAYGPHNSVPGSTTVLNGNSQFTWASAVTGTHTVTFIIDYDGDVSETDESNNSISIPVTVQPVLHSVTGLVRRVDSNAGVGGVSLRLRDAITHSDVGSKSATTTSNGTYTFTGVGTGAYELLVLSVPAGSNLALPAGAITAPTLNASSAATVQGPAVDLATTLPDLAPTPILRVTAGTLVAGQSVQFDSGVQNTGTPASGSFTVRWKVDGQDVNPIAYGPHNSVPGSTTVLNGNSQFTWASAVTGTHTVSFIVDYSGQVQETNEANNVATFTVIVF